jgi:hypothetical protein
MNERIKELAMQANSHHDNFFDLNYKELDVFLEKFSELLIQECHALVDYENKQFIKAQFKEYFGVK